MKTYLKAIPYIIIIGLLVTVYFGFRYMSNQISNLKEQTTLLEVKNAQLLNNIITKENISQITIDQLKQFEYNIHQALDSTSKQEEKIESFILSGDRKEMLDKINAYEKCMSINSLKPEVICELELQ